VGKETTNVVNSGRPMIFSGLLFLLGVGKETTNVVIFNFVFLYKIWRFLINYAQKHFTEKKFHKCNTQIPVYVV